MRPIATALAVLAAITLSVAPAGAEPDEQRPLVAATFSSGFCAACRILNPRIAELAPAFADQPVAFVKFDQTASLVTGRRLDRLAAENGIADVWSANKGRTGFALVVDPEDGAVLDTLTVGQSAEEMAARITRALAVARPQNAL